MKRITAMLLAVLFTLGCFGGVLAAEEGIMPLASPTIMGQSASMKAGSETGELRISYNINATRTADEVGVSTIELYNAEGGDYVTTIYGSKANGLIRYDTVKNMGTYSYKDATPGGYYYAEVTLYATIGNESDSEVITTATVRAPW